MVAILEASSPVRVGHVATARPARPARPAFDASFDASFDAPSRAERVETRFDLSRGGASAPWPERWRGRGAGGRGRNAANSAQEDAELERGLMVGRVLFVKQRRRFLVRVAGVFPEKTRVPPP